MNLIDDPWIPIRTCKGNFIDIAPWQLTQNIGTDTGIAAPAAPRADFNGALVQFLIGLLQTAFAPKDDRGWERLYYNPPSPDEIKAALAPWRDAFMLDGDGQRFMQDLDLDTKNLKPLEIGSLLIDTPGANTILHNQDHFIKRDTVKALSLPMAALALFTLQTNAPAGGAGYRTSLRGGGPLTTLAVPDPAHEPDRDTLWHLVWLNVLPAKRFRPPDPTRENGGRDRKLPWLAPTRTSDAKAGGRDTTPEDAHPLQMYWGMPRRIRLDLDRTGVGNCDLSGNPGVTVRRYWTRNYGTNYTGPWMHPLSPHRRDKDGLPIPLHPQPGGFGYRHWLGLVLGEGEDNAAARVVKWSWSRNVGPKRLRLWAFGYDMDNMKARCWYESLMPVWHMEEDIAHDLTGALQEVLEATRMVSDNLRQALKNAWIRKGLKVSGDLSAIQSAFWQETEPDFFTFLHDLYQTIQEEREDIVLRQAWFRLIHGKSVKLFDTWTASAEVGEADPKRIAVARSGLVKFNNKKSIRQALRLEIKAAA